MKFTEMINRMYSLTGVWHWETVEVHTTQNGWQTAREYAPGEYRWEFSDDGSMTYVLSSEPVIVVKYNYRPHEMLNIYAGREGSGEWWAVEWVTADTIILYPSDKNDPCLHRSKLRRSGRG